MDHKLHITLREETFQKLNELKKHYDDLYEFADRKFSYTNIIAMCIHNEHGFMKNYEESKQNDL